MNSPTGLHNIKKMVLLGLLVIAVGIGLQLLFQNLQTIRFLDAGGIYTNLNEEQQAAVNDWFFGAFPEGSTVRQFEMVTAVRDSSASVCLCCTKQDFENFLKSTSRYTVEQTDNRVAAFSCNGETVYVSYVIENGTEQVKLTRNLAFDRWDLFI